MNPLLKPQDENYYTVVPDEILEGDGGLSIPTLISLFADRVMKGWARVIDPDLFSR